jgi:hypothetical protein
LVNKIKIDLRKTDSSLVVSFFVLAAINVSVLLLESYCYYY